MHRKNNLLRALLLIIFLLVGPSAGQAQNIYPQGELESGLYYAPDGDIIVSGVTTSSEPHRSVVFFAEGEVIIGDGFHAKPGTVFYSLTGDILDSDADGLPDWWETIHFDSLSQNAQDDPDQDGLTNLQEYQQQSDPTLFTDNTVDTDHDGLADAWEIACFGNLDQDGRGDFDQDGVSNLLEQWAKTDPKQPVSRPKPGTYYEYDAAGRIKKIYKVK